MQERPRKAIACWVGLGCDMGFPCQDRVVLSDFLSRQCFVLCCDNVAIKVPLSRLRRS